MKDFFKNIIFTCIITSLSIGGMVLYVNNKTNLIENKLIKNYERNELKLKQNSKKIAALEDIVSKQDKLIEKLNKSVIKQDDLIKQLNKSVSKLDEKNLEVKDLLLQYDNLKKEYMFEIDLLKEEVESNSDEISNSLNDYNYEKEIKDLFNRTEYLEQLLPAKFKIDIDHPIKENETYQVDVIFENILNFNKNNIKWEIENKDIASIDENGNIIPIKPGTTKVIAKYDKYVSETILIVESLPEYPDNINLQNLGGLNSFSVGDSNKIRVIYYPADVKNTNGTWSSSDENVVSINQNGVFLCKAVGLAKITFTTTNGKTAEIVINVAN